MSDVQIVFIDSNILFSTCYRTPNLFEKLWTIPGLRIVTASYCVEEVRRNLRMVEQLTRLRARLNDVLVVDDCTESELPNDLMLPAKDVPVLCAASRCHADILITGDRNHFERYFGHRVLGVLIESPGMFRLRFPEIFK